MDLLTFGGLFLAACAIFGNHDDDDKGKKKRRNRRRSSTNKNYLDGLAWQQDHHVDLGL